MKRSDVLVCVMLLAPIFLFSQPGSSCASPLSITMDSVSRSYTISASTGSNMVCTSLGTSPVTYFSLVANSSAQNMILRITGPNTSWVEVAFYSGTSCTNGNLETASSICFYDGTGLWSPSPDFVITPNQTYILRIKTTTTGTLTIQGYYYTPPNNSCATARPIGTILSFDNNAAHKPATGISPAGACVVNFTNTALYSYTVEYTGATSISLENLVCDNNYESDGNNLGFQVGIFKGSCAGLTNVACYIGVPGTFQFSAGTQTAGTQMYVTVNGILSSNCEYGIRAVNAVVLGAELKYFTAFKSANGNILKWVSLKEYDNAFFEIERSLDGITYKALDRIPGQGNSKAEKDYQYVDPSPLSKSFYRLKMITTAGKISYSNVIRVDRQQQVNSKITFSNVVTSQLMLKVTGMKRENLDIKIVDNSGREMYHQAAKLMSDFNIINVNTLNFARGSYYLVVSNDNYKEGFTFFKL
ncbi:MAG TPA: hypothetical protein VF144_08215 [Chitinophagaceae bacterium]